MVGVVFVIVVLVLQVLLTLLVAAVADEVVLEDVLVVEVAEVVPVPSSIQLRMDMSVSLVAAAEAVVVHGTVEQ